MRAHCKFFGLLLAVAFLLSGCDKGNPALKQQLTVMIGELRTDHAVPKAIADLDAILAVNSKTLSGEQSKKLTKARDKMVRMREMLKDHSVFGNEKYYTSLLSEAKTLIGEAASTF